MTTPTIRSKYRFREWTSSSGRMPSEMVVKLRISEKRTDITLFSPTRVSSGFAKNWWITSRARISEKRLGPLLLPLRRNRLEGKSLDLPVGLLEALEHQVESPRKLPDLVMVFHHDALGRDRSWR